MKVQSTRFAWSIQIEIMNYRIYLSILLFSVLQLIVLYTNTLLVHKCRRFPRTTMAVKVKEADYLEKTDIASLMKTNAMLVHENSMLRQLLREVNNGSTTKHPTAEITKSLSSAKKTRKTNINLKWKDLVTIILCKEKEINDSCLETRKYYLQQMFPDINIASTSDSKSPGAAFNELFPKVKTKYFYFLNSKHELMEQNVEHSVYKLLQDLENVPELDFISGSIIVEDRLEIPCYRLQLCNWTLSQRYEYKRSIGELMICENIASSFMGRTLSVKRIFYGQKQIFDEKMTKLSTTDFFLRAKNAGAICGIHPEVMMKLSEERICTFNITENNLEYYQALLPFAHKHKVFRFKDPDLQTLDLCGEDSPLAGNDICNEPIAHEIMLNGGHWAYNGTFAYPYVIRNLQQCLFKMADFFTTRGIRFYVDAGVAMGAIKMRGVLPWESGDVDVAIFHNTPTKLYSMMEYFAKSHNYTIKNRLDIDGQIQVFCVPGLGDEMGGLISMFPNDEDSTKLIKIKTNGRWIPYKLEIFEDMRRTYGENYLQHVMHHSSENVHCKINHNACLPDFRINGGTGGTYNEWFCSL